jgi:putative peptidoglycan binding protein/transglycosylase-like protein with SLT domain
MTSFSRSLKFTLPMMRGQDVVALQRRLRMLNIVGVAQPDGLFGPNTETAVKAFQKSHGLKIDGVAGPITLQALFKDVDKDDEPANILFSTSTLEKLTTPHFRFPGSVLWSLTKSGLSISAKPPSGTAGDPTTVKRIWDSYGQSIRRWSEALDIPAELIIATICTESGGNPSARREEPGYISDAQTPNKVSPGLMQTLISTARSTLQLGYIDADWLLDPDNSIRAGTAYIAQQSNQTLCDPPVVACAYNAGGVYKNDSDHNRWRMRQYPIGTAEHADRYVQWFNDCFRVFDQMEKSAAEELPKMSWYTTLQRIA